MLQHKLFQETLSEKKTDLFILKNRNNLIATFSNHGARIVSLLVPDKNGEFKDVILGFPSLKAYQNPSESYYGSIIGRFANRISKGKFKLDGKEYNLFINNGVNSLHGGAKGFQDMVWDTTQTNTNNIEFNYVSQDMEEGYPGELSVKVTYSLTDNNELIIDYEASSDKTTVINLTNHAFFNLNGEGSGSVLEHQLQINSKYYTPIDSSLIPTGILEDVLGTPFDFRKPTLISEHIKDDHIQLNYGRGYDHNFVLNPQKTDHLFHAASMIGDKSGILMEVYTHEPGIQFYSGNFMEGNCILKSGAKNGHRTAFCLETQHFPDSPNQPAFPSTQLNPSDIYKTSTVYKFSQTII